MNIRKYISLRAKKVFRNILNTNKCSNPSSFLTKKRTLKKLKRKETSCIIRIREINTRLFNRNDKLKIRRSKS